MSRKITIPKADQASQQARERQTTHRAVYELFWITGISLALGVANPRMAVQLLSIDSIVLAEETCCTSSLRSICGLVHHWKGWYRAVLLS